MLRHDQMASLQQQLWDGASGGDLIKVKQAIAAGVNMDAGDPKNVSGLTGVVRQLLVAGGGCCECSGWMSETG